MHCLGQTAALSPPLLLLLQVKALTGSLLLTGLAAAGGFYALQSFGFVNSEAPTSMSAFGRAWDMVGRPLPPQQQQQQQTASGIQQQQGGDP
jgi:hypothetical protein